MVDNLTNILNADGLDRARKEELEALLNVRRSVSARNSNIAKYYESDVAAKHIGIDKIPPQISIEECCSWPKKAVTSVSERSRFDSFVFSSGESDISLSRMVVSNSLVGSYNRHVASELMHGCMFATVGRAQSGSIVRFHTAETAAATWNAGAARIASGMVIADFKRTSYSPRTPVPVQVNMHLPGEVDVIRRVDASQWVADVLPTPLDRPMMEPFSFRATGIKPFGESRISKQVMAITDDVIRTLVYMAVSGAFYATPQRYMIGLSEEQFDMMKNDTWGAVIGAMLLGTRDDDGAPQVGQFAQASPQPYIDMLRTYATMFSAATGVPVNSLGIVQDNPSSAQAISASREDICIAAEDLNQSSAESLRNVALMAMAVDGNCLIDELSDDQKSVMAHFRDPSMPSIVSQADAAVKVASADAGFAGTDVFYEMLGFDAATIARIKKDKKKAQATEAINALLGGSDDSATLGA